MWTSWYNDTHFIAILTWQCSFCKNFELLCRLNIKVMKAVQILLVFGLRWSLNRPKGTSLHLHSAAKVEWVLLVEEVVHEWNYNHNFTIYLLVYSYWIVDVMCFLRDNMKDAWLNPLDCRSFSDRRLRSVYTRTQSTIPKCGFSPSLLTCKKKKKPVPTNLSIPAIHVPVHFHQFPFRDSYVFPSKWSKCFTCLPAPWNLCLFFLAPLTLSFTMYCSFDIRRWMGLT